MKKFSISIQEILEREVVIEAENKRDAMDKIKQMYKDEEIVLDSEDFSYERFILNGEVVDGEIAWDKGEEW